MRARDVMTSPAITVTPGTTVKEAATLLAVNGFTALPVLDDDDRLIGIVTEADLVRDRFPYDPRYRHLHPDPESVPAAPVLYQAHLEAGELAYQWSPEANRAVFYPRVICPFSGSDRLEWRVSAGLGTVYATTV